MTDGLGSHRNLRAEGPPAASEDIHLPPPTALPFIVAVGVTVALVGVVISPIVFGIGMVIWIVAVLMWIREARGEIAELPLDHG